MKNLPLTNIEKFKVFSDEEIRKVYIRNECFWLSLDEKHTIHVCFINHNGFNIREGITIEWEDNPFNITLDDNYIL